MIDLCRKVRETIRKYGMLSPAETVLAAVSGGPDSVALLRLLAGLKEELGIRLEVAHLQHGIRGEEAREDALFVARLAEELALPFHLKEVELGRARAREGGGNLEAMGRKERYRFFADLARQRNISKVATAHTRDDQVETLLMWLLRGSGRRGLGGMPPVRELLSGREGSAAGTALVRPLIESSREEIAAFLAAGGFESRTDKTNLDPAPLRNWIRLRLLPQVRERLDPGLDRRLARAAEILRDEEEVLERLTRSALGRALSGEGLDRGNFLEFDKGMQRRLLRVWFESALGDTRGIAFDHVEEARRWIAGGAPQGRLSVARGWELVRRYGAVRLEKRRRGKRAACYDYRLLCGGELVIPEAGVKVRSGLVSSHSAVRPRDDSEAIFDLAFLPEGLTVRNFRRGDRFHPLGMDGHKKLKDLFIEKKVPLEVRSALPLFLADDEILWIPNYGRSEVAKVGPETSRILHIRLEPYPG